MQSPHKLKASKYTGLALFLPMTFPVLCLVKSDRVTFLDFWSSCYDYRDEARYSEYIDRKPLEKNTIIELFRWKNRMKLSSRKLQSIENNCIKRLDKLRELGDNFTPDAFFKTFKDGRAIWRIFFLHINSPKQFPIFDQHVYRAMQHIKGAPKVKLPSNQERIIRIYVDEYLPFFKGFDAKGDRRVDKALWAFGKFVNLPCKKLWES